MYRFTGVVLYLNDTGVENLIWKSFLIAKYQIGFWCIHVSGSLC